MKHTVWKIYNYNKRPKTAVKFTKDGHIACKCSSFDFKNFYGEKGQGFIKMHYTKPIFQYQTED